MCGEETETEKHICETCLKAMREDNNKADGSKYE
jgi:hypothetical protein